MRGHSIIRSTPFILRGDQSGLQQVEDELFLDLKGQGDTQFINGGFTYLITNNFQVDIRVGMGLNDKADDLITGVGFAWRF